MNVLVACECSGRVRDAFIAKGHNAWSCDILPTEAPGPHYERDVFDVLYDGWDAVIAFPPCTYLCGSGLHWLKRQHGRRELMEKAIEFVTSIWNAPAKRLVIENPVGILSSRLAKPSQYIQPYEFGENASKKTCLWIKGLPSLQSTNRIAGRKVEWPRGSGKIVERWDNQTDSGQNKLGPSDDRAAIRAKTYLGIASAMAEQWGGLL